MIIAGSGHRPNRIIPKNMPVIQKLQQFMLQQLNLIKPDKVITGMSLGYDMSLVKAAMQLNIPVIAAMAFKGQQEKWSDQLKYQYQKILGKCQQVIYFSQGGYCVHKIQRRNMQMIDRCDKLLVLWNGTSGNPRYCIQYAMQINKDVINLWDDWLRYTPLATSIRSKNTKHINL